MKIKIEELQNHLKSGLKSVYIVGGDEPLLRDEACDLIRKTALASGCEERKVFYVESGFDWTALSMEADNYSLFSQQKILELRINSGKIGDQGNKVLLNYLQNIPEDTLLMVIVDKIDQKIQKTKWFSLLDKVGVVVQIWPINQRSLPGWISQRMRARGIKPIPDVVSLIAYRTEGNVLAAAQEVEKLYLIYGNEDINTDDVTASVFENARFDVFQLVDMALLGDAKQVNRILNELRAEGVETVIILWAFAREIRGLVTMAWQMHYNRVSSNQALSQARVWPKRKAAVSACLQRHNYSEFLILLKMISHIDKIIKGMKPGNIWDELLQLCLNIADSRYMRLLQRVRP